LLILNVVVMVLDWFLTKFILLGNTISIIVSFSIGMLTIKFILSVSETSEGDRMRLLEESIAVSPLQQDTLYVFSMTLLEEFLM
jgi:hypothetical protein